MEKVIKLIDDLVAELKQDQINDDNKQEYCADQFDLFMNTPVSKAVPTEDASRLSIAISFHS